MDRFFYMPKSEVITDNRLDSRNKRGLLILNCIFDGIKKSEDKESEHEGQEE